MWRTSIYDANDLRVAWNYDHEGVEEDIHLILSPVLDQTEPVVRIRGTAGQIDALVHAIGEAWDRAIRRHEEHQAEKAAVFAAWQGDVASGKTELGLREYRERLHWENGD